MADPHIIPKMDRIDRMTVFIYRAGLIIACPATTLLAWGENRLLLLSVAMCASTLHLYLKSFRLLLQMSAWMGLLLSACGFPNLGIACCFITLGGLCYKEHFCFKVPALQLQPWILGTLWFSMFFNFNIAEKILTPLASILFCIVAIAKSRMPLHYDIGDRSKYEI